MASYELAFRMQMSAPEATDVSSEIGCDQEAVRPGRSGERGFRRTLPAGAPAGGARCSFRAGVVRQRHECRPTGMATSHCDKNHQARAAQTDKAVAAC